MLNSHQITIKPQDGTVWAKIPMVQSPFPCLNQVFIANKNWLNHVKSMILPAM
jgi:hypothetical protein